MKALFNEATYEEQCMMNDVLSYVLAEPYQKLQKSYGLLREGPSHYYTMGWDCILPECEERMLTSRILHRLELLSAFPFAVETAWFQENLSSFLHYKAEDNAFALPKTVLQEKNHIG